MKNTYAQYLRLDRLLSAQRLATGSDDELLFIVIHQQHELWFKLAIHELDCAIRSLTAENAGDSHCVVALKRLARVSAIQRILISSWDVLATLTPDEFFLFRETVGRDGASGFQSVQYRILEFRLGLKYRTVEFETPGGGTTTIDVFAGAPSDADRAALQQALAAPGIYDAVIAFMARTLARFGIGEPRNYEEKHQEERRNLQRLELCLQKPAAGPRPLSARRAARRSGGRVPAMAVRPSRHRVAGHRQQRRDRRVERP